MRGLAFLLAIASTGGALAAEPIDLTGPHGDKYGSINRNGQEVAADAMLLLTEEALVTAASACEITGRDARPDGSLDLTTQCQMEGEPEPSTVVFTVKRDPAGADALQVVDDTGYVMGSVKPCG